MGKPLDLESQPPVEKRMGASRPLDPSVEERVARLEGEMRILISISLAQFTATLTLAALLIGHLI